MSLTKVDTPLKEFGRSGMVEITRFSGDHRPINGDNDNNNSIVNNSNIIKDHISVTDSYRASSFRYVVPFPVKLYTDDVNYETAYAVITETSILFYLTSQYHSKNDFVDSLHTKYPPNAKTSILDYGEITEPKKYDIRFLHFSYSDREVRNTSETSKIYFREFIYNSPENDFIIYRVEDGNSGAYVLEVWLTQNGEIQIFANSPFFYGEQYQGNMTCELWTEVLDYSSAGDILCDDCPLCAGVTGRETIRVDSGAFYSSLYTRSAHIAVTLNSVTEVQELQFANEMSAEELASYIASLSWKNCTVNTSTEMDASGLNIDAYNVTFTASSAGEFKVEFLSGDFPDEDIEVVDYTDTPELRTVGKSPRDCNYYTSGSYCYFGTPDQDHYLYHDITSLIRNSDFYSTGVLRTYFKLKGDGSVSTPEYNSHLHYDSENPYGFVGSLDISKSAYRTTEFLNMYVEDIRPEYKPLFLNLDGVKVKANLMLADSDPTGADRKLDCFRLNYGGKVYCGVNPAEAVDNIVSPIMIPNRLFDYGYVGNSLAWTNIKVFGIYPVLERVTKVRVLWYAPAFWGYSNYDFLPTNSFPDICFAYYQAYASGGNSSSNANLKTATLSSVETGDVQGRPHILEFNFDTPVRIANWAILPPRVSGDYLLPDIEKCILGINFFTSDGEAIKYL